MSGTLTVIPTKSVNGITFGTDRETVRKTFGEFSEFRKGPFSNNTTDNFKDFHIYYDEDNRFEAIEIFGSEVVVDNKKIFPGKLSGFLSIFPNLTSEEKGYWTDKTQSVGLTAPNKKIEGVLFGKPGYYK